MSQDLNKPLANASEAAEPKAESSPVPVLLIGLFALLFFWGLLNLENHAGGFDGRVYMPYKDFAEVDDSQFHDPVVEMRIKGQRLFGANCSACHQNSGMGLPGQFPPLAGSDWVNAKVPNRIVRIVLCGFHGPLVLNGQPFTTSATMTPFRETLKDEDIAAILTFVRSNKEWHNDAPAVDPALVKLIRDKVKTHADTFTPDELLKVSETEDGAPVKADATSAPAKAKP